MGISTPGGGSAFSSTEITQIASPGVLIALSVQVIGDLFPSFSAYVTAGLKIGSGTVEGRIIEFIHGYVKTEQGLTWTGFYEIKEDHTFFLHIRGSLEPVYKLTDHRLTTTREGALFDVVRKLQRPV